jgi:chitinase
MSRIARLLTVLVALIVLSGGASVSADTETSVGTGPVSAGPAGDPLPPVVVGYYPNWVGSSGYFPRDIAARNFTHIDYAFAEPTSAGTCALTDPNADYLRAFPAAQSVNGRADRPNQKLRGNFNQLKQLKAAHPGLKVMISIGGWTLSKYFSDIAAGNRRAFVRSCINLFIKGNLPVSGSQGGAGAARGVFDGIDLDWEFPVCCGEPGNHYRPEDRENATLLIAEFRNQLDTYGDLVGKRYDLTAAIPGGTVGNDHYQLRKVGEILTWINLMTYDMHGPWDAATNFDSPFKHDPADPTASTQWTVKGTVNYFLAHGVHADSLVVGVPFYGYQYLRAGAANHGLYQAFDNTGLDGSGGWKTSETPTYHQLVDVGGIVTSPSSGTPVGRKGYTRYWSPEAAEPWLWNPATPRGGEPVSAFITYEDRISIAERVRYVRNKGLRGLMAWEVSLDSNDHDLSNALGALLR